MVSAGLMTALFVILGRFAMVSRRMLMVFCGLAMVVCRGMFVCHWDPPEIKLMTLFQP